MLSTQFSGIGNSGARQMKKINLLNISLDNLSLVELLEQLKAGVVFTPNVDHLVKLQRDPDFLQIYEVADYKVCDSKILYYVSRFLGSPIREKISGSDLFPAFYEYHKSNEDIKIFLLGGNEGVADQARHKINAKVGRQIIVSSHSPSFDLKKTRKNAWK